MSKLFFLALVALLISLAVADLDVQNIQDEASPKEKKEKVAQQLALEQKKLDALKQQLKKAENELATISKKAAKPAESKEAAEPKQKKAAQPKKKNGNVKKQQKKFKGVPKVKPGKLEPLTPVQEKNLAIKALSPLAWYRPAGVVANKEGEVLVWKDSAGKLDLRPRSLATAPKVVKSGINKRPSVRFQHSGVEAKGLRLGKAFDVFAVLKYTGDPLNADNKWGQSNAFTVNSQGFTPKDAKKNAKKAFRGGVGLALRNGGDLLPVAEGVAWGVGPEVGNKAVVALLRRTKKDRFQVFIDGKRVGTLAHAPREGDIFKLGTSYSASFGWEGLISEVVVFNRVLSKKQAINVQKKLKKVYRKQADA